MSSEKSESDTELKKLSTEVIDLLQKKLEKKRDLGNLSPNKDLAEL